MRIGITVPNELLKQVKQISPKVNVSQVCREALKHRVEVAYKAIAQAASDGVDEHVAWLDRSVAKQMLEPDWVALALYDARDWVRTVTPEAWRLFVHQADVLRRQARDEAEMVDIWSQGGGGNIGLPRRLWENKDWFERQSEIEFQTGVTSDVRQKAIEEYSRAWLGYVYEVRRLLEERHKEEYDRVMDERAAQRRNRPKPELPWQLL